MGKIKNERFVLRDDVFSTGDHELFRYHRKKDCFHADKVLSLNEQVKKAYFNQFVSLAVESDLDGRLSVVSACRFVSGKQSDSFFFVVKGKNPNPYVMKKYGLKREDFLNGKDDLDIMSRLTEFFDKTRHVLCFDGKSALSILEAYQVDLQFDYVELFPLLRVLYPDFSSYSLEFLEEKFSIETDPLVKENDVISMGKIFLLVCSSSGNSKKKEVSEEHTENKNQEQEKKIEDDSDFDRKSVKDTAPSSFPSSFSKKVDQFDRDGNYIKTFSSIGEASRETGVGNKEIRIACNSEKMKKLNKGFRFQWSEK